MMANGAEDQTTSQIDFMCKTSRFFCQKSDLFEMVTIPFGNGNYSFKIVRPTEGVSISECQKALSGGKWNQFINSSVTGKKLEINLPKFDVEFNNNIKNTLGAMGMKKAMSERDFYLVSPGGVKIDYVQHGAHFKVDEEGAEAAAATAVIEAATAWYDPSEPVPFYLDHPFIYLITEKESGAILFIGCVKSL